MDLKALLPEIEAAAVRGWPARDTVGVDGWLWRHASGGSIRANSVAALTYTGHDIAQSIGQVEQLARDRHVAACFAISNVSAPADLDAKLAALGYLRGADHVTMAEIVDHEAAMPEGVELTSKPSPGWLAAYLSGLSLDRRLVAPAILERLPKSARFISALAQGRTITSGLTIPDGRLASVQCMATLPDGQRQGGAQRVLQAIECLAARHGQIALYLQTDAENHAAQALYRRAGFSIVGRYHTRTKTL